MISALYFWTLILVFIFMGLTLWFEPSHVVDQAKAKRHKIIRNLFALVLFLLIIWLSYLSFTLTLTLIVIVMGVIFLIDQIWFRHKRLAANKPEPIVVEYARSLFVVLLLVWVIRSFIVQPYRIPTGSLEPTVKPGELIVVNQFAYGLRLPVIRKKIINIGEPKVGDIVVFHWPVEPATLFVKRVIGIPGDHIVYKNKVLTINGKEMQQKTIGQSFDLEPGRKPVPVEIKEENLNSVKHKIYVQKTGGETGDFDITVPKDMYFMMGDNRDDSGDSRYWGYVPERDLVGKALFIWMSWDPFIHRIRFNRIGTWVK